jgi:hypothetical protein
VHSLFLEWPELLGRSVPRALSTRHQVGASDSGWSLASSSRSRRDDHPLVASGVFPSAYHRHKTIGGAVSNERGKKPVVGLSGHWKDAAVHFRIPIGWKDLPEEHRDGFVEEAARRILERSIPTRLKPPTP